MVWMEREEVQKYCWFPRLIGSEGMSLECERVIQLERRVKVAKTNTQVRQLAIFRRDDVSLLVASRRPTLLYHVSLILVLTDGAGPETLSLFPIVGEAWHRNLIARILISLQGLHHVQQRAAGVRSIEAPGHAHVG